MAYPIGVVVSTPMGEGRGWFQPDYTERQIIHWAINVFRLDTRDAIEMAYKGEVVPAGATLHQLGVQTGDTIDIVATGSNV